MTRDEIVNELGITKANLRLYLSWFAQSGELSSANIETVKRVIQLRRRGIAINNIEGFSAHLYRKGRPARLLLLLKNRHTDCSGNEKSDIRSDTIVRYRFSQALSFFRVAILALIQFLLLHQVPLCARILQSLIFSLVWNLSCGLLLTFLDYIVQYRNCSLKKHRRHKQG